MEEVATASSLLEQAERLRQEQQSELIEEMLDLVVFRLAGEHYALPAASIRAVVGKSPITPLPGTPSHLLGLTNQRGEILSVLDFRPLLGLGEANGESDFLVITQVGEHALALVVDSCPDLVRLPASALQPVGAQTVGAAYLQGQLAVESGLVFLLNPAAVFEA